MQPMHQIADVQNFLKEMESQFRAPPNPDENWWELRKNAERSFRETGNAIFWVVKNRIGSPAEIYLILTANAMKSCATKSRPEQRLVKNWKGENIVIPSEDIREFRTMLTYGIKPPEPDTKTVFIEIPAGASLAERDCLTQFLTAAALPGITFAVLPPGVRAVSPSRYGVREELEEYAYECWGETAAEVMAMQRALTGREPEGTVIKTELRPKTTEEKELARRIREENRDPHFGKGVVLPPKDSSSSATTAVAIYDGQTVASANKILGPVTENEWRQINKRPTTVDGDTTFMEPFFVDALSMTGIRQILEIRDKKDSKRWSVEETATLLHPDVQAGATQMRSAQTEANWKACWSGLLQSRGLPDGTPLTTDERIDMLRDDPQILDKRICETCQHIASYPAPCCQDCVRCKRPTRKYRESDNAKLLTSVAEASRLADEREAELREIIDKEETRINQSAESVQHGKNWRSLRKCILNAHGVSPEQQQILFPDSSAAVIHSNPNEWLEESADRVTWTRVPPNSRAVLRYVRKCGETDKSSWEGSADDTQPNNPEATPH